MNRPGELLSAIQRLKRATHELQREWTETQQTWHDQTACEFQADHLDPLLPVLRIVMAATAETEEVYRWALLECADPEHPGTGG